MYTSMYALYLQEHQVLLFLSLSFLNPFLVKAAVVTCIQETMILVISRENGV